MENGNSGDGGFAGLLLVLALLVGLFYIAKESEREVTARSVQINAAGVVTVRETVYVERHDTVYVFPEAVKE